MGKTGDGNPPQVVRLELKPEELANKFAYIMNKLGFRTGTGTVVHLINDAYDRCQREDTEPGENTQPPSQVETQTEA